LEERPVVRRRFVRVKVTLYGFRDGGIRVSLKFYKEYLEFDLSKAWFLSRIPGNAVMGEIMLKEGALTITFRFPEKMESLKGGIAWDCNEKSLDGFNPEIGWVRVDLSQLFHIHRVYELKRRRLQSKAVDKKNPGIPEGSETG
jgi:putative transposase